MVVVLVGILFQINGTCTTLTGASLSCYISDLNLYQVLESLLVWLCCRYDFGHVNFEFWHQLEVQVCLKTEACSSNDSFKH